MTVRDFLCIMMNAGSKKDLRVFGWVKRMNRVLL
jgi:hypothetical protein